MFRAVSEAGASKESAPRAGDTRLSKTGRERPGLGPALGVAGSLRWLALWQRGRSERGLPWGGHLVPAMGAAGWGKR